MQKYNYINLVSLKCGRFDKKIPIHNKTQEEVDSIIASLVYDKKKFILIKT